MLMSGTFVLGAITDHLQRCAFASGDQMVFTTGLQRLTGDGPAPRPFLASMCQPSMTAVDQSTRPAASTPPTGFGAAGRRNPRRSTAAAGASTSSPSRT